MKPSLILLILPAALALAACGKGGETATVTQKEMQQKADIAKASLQEKADALAREASMQHAKPIEKKH